MENQEAQVKSDTIPETVKQFAVLGMAAMWLVVADNRESKNDIADEIANADQLGDALADKGSFRSAYYRLRSAVYYNALREFDFNEYYYQGLFKRYASEVLPGCKIIKRGNNNKHVPDSWVSIDGEAVPVEVKLGDFDKIAMRQLKRYMDFYKCSQGVAVGARKSVEPWPENVFFIPNAALQQIYENSKEYRDNLIKSSEQNIRWLESVTDGITAIVPPDVLAQAMEILDTART